MRPTGRIKKAESRLINLWVPRELFPILDEAVRREDSDRSKFIRLAIREKIQRVNGCAVIKLVAALIILTSGSRPVDQSNEFPTLTYTAPAPTNSVICAGE